MIFRPQFTVYLTSNILCKVTLTKASAASYYYQDFIIPCN